MKVNVKPLITVKILKEEKGYGATARIGEKFIDTCGYIFDELKEMILDSVNLAFEKKVMFSFDEMELIYDL